MTCFHFLPINSVAKTRSSVGGRISIVVPSALRLTVSLLTVPTLELGTNSLVYQVSRSDRSGRNNQPATRSGTDKVGFKSKRPSSGPVLKPGSLRDNPSAAASYDQ